MATHDRLIGATALALALAAGLLGAGAVRAAEPPAADDEYVDDAHPAVSILDADARSAIEARLKAHRQTVVVTRFSVAPGAAANRKGLSSEGCPVSDAPATAPAAGESQAAPFDPALLDKIRDRLAKRLKRKATLAITRNAERAPPEALVVSGCITRYEAGDAAKRFVGFNMGGSFLGAHVRLGEKLRTGVKPVAEFDILLKSRNLLPPMSPVGLAVRTVSIQRQTLNANATHLANRTADAIEKAFGVLDD